MLWPRSFSKRIFRLAAITLIVANWNLQLRAEDAAEKENGEESAAITSDAAPAVCAEARQRSASNSSSSMAEYFRKTYPSCADWLSRACSSSAGRATEPLLSRSSSMEGQSLCLDCLRSEISLGKDPTQVISNLARQLPGGGGPSSMSSSQASLVNAAMAQWNQVNEKRKQDLNSILDVFEKEKLPQKLRISAVRASLDTLQERILSASERAGASSRIGFQKFVAEQIQSASQDYEVEWQDENGDLQTDVEPGIINRLKQEPNDQSRFRELVNRAQQVDTGEDADFDGNLTPYHSKMILLYHLENSLHAKYPSQPAKVEAILDQLASRLFLKADYSGKGQASQWKWIVPHDGFVLSADVNQISNLVRAREGSGTGAGIDCSTFVQQSLVEAGYKDLSKVGRLTTAGMATGGQLKAVADVRVLNSSSLSQLGPGDVLIRRPSGDPIGHAEVVVGYEGDPPQLVTIGATGGYQRTILKRKLDIYPNQPTDCGEDNYLSRNQYETDGNGDPMSHTFYRATLKKGRP